MIRTFQTHRIRREEELTEKLWTFTPLGREEAPRSVPVPSCWETYPGFGDYRGEGRYATRFAGEGNLRVVCKGVSHTAQVYLDGALIARHYNAYTPFSAVVRGVPAGEHTLEIVADNRFSEESALHVPNDYMSYGGISRPVSVEQIGSAYLRFLHVTPRFADGKWRAHVRVCVENLCEEAPMSVQVCLAGECLVFAERTMSAGETVLEGEVTAENASPWSPATPVLYTAEARLMKNGVPFEAARSRSRDDLRDRARAERGTDAQSALCGAGGGSHPRDDRGAL